MKKAILVLMMSVSSACILTYAQDTDFDSLKGIESDKVLNLSADQIAKIKKLNQEYGLKFQAIGKSRIPGYEKGQRKRALAQEKREAIRKLLSSEQISGWESKYGYTHYNRDMDDVVKDNYDARLKQLERKYDRDKDAIEDDYSLSKSERKSRLNKLKHAYKAEKNRLKDERDEAKRYGLQTQ